MKRSYVPHRVGVVLFGVAAVFATPLSAQQLDPVLARIHVTPSDVPVRALETRGAFAGLTDREKQYAYWMSVASWRGAPIVAAQVSPESPRILDFLLQLYTRHPQRLRIECTRSGITDEELAQVDDYAARFFSNLGNYLEYGDTKFVPALPDSRFAAIVDVAARLGGGRADDGLRASFEQVRGVLYSLSEKERRLSFPESGVTGYYGPDVTEADVEFARRYLESKKIEPWNTRLVNENAGREKILKVRIASVKRQEIKDSFEGRPILIGYGDFSEPLSKVVEALKRAGEYTANDFQREMLRKYVEHFVEGHIDLHKDAMRAWVKDIGPAVETNLGFIETYRDPAKVRAEWEGLVAVVNRKDSEKLERLVGMAHELIPLLPWPKEFEKDTFQRPDFTSLDVLAFANAGIPAGINIPNYDDIRMSLGFKNVSLGNVLGATNKSTERAEFIADEDQALFGKLRGEAFHVQVGLHELLGHGSGKLLTENEDGTFNFDRALIDPLTSAPVKTWYKPGQTWNTVFGRISTAYEECRAEAVGLHLCDHPGVLELFGHGKEDAADVVYVNWLIMARAGVDALTVYDVDSNSFGQSHSHARYVLMRVMLEAGEGFLRIDQDAEGRFVVRLDRSKIESVGKPAIARFLRSLGVLKATGDAEQGQALFAHFSEVDDSMKALRDYALRVKKPRHIWVQPILDQTSRGEVILREYPATDRGVIDSSLDRFGR